MTELSDHSRDKLDAVLNQAYPDANNDLGPADRTACEHWFAQLTEGERWRLRGAEADAEQLAALPPAPAFPLKLLQCATFIAAAIWLSWGRRRRPTD
jgi:hypothetical protein